MSEQDQNIVHTPIEMEMESSYLAYAMSVIVSRALPDAKRRFKTSSSKSFICHDGA